MNQNSLDHQTAIVVAALAGALCKQSSINGEQLRLDMLEILEGIARSPSGVESVGMNVALLMDSVLRASRSKP